MNPDPIKIITDIPTIAWLDFIVWASSQKDFIDNFSKDTGEKLIPMPTNALAALIDKATGADKHNQKVMKVFVVWVTINYWGEDEAPRLYFEKFKPVGAGHEPDRRMCRKKHLKD